MNLWSFTHGAPIPRILSAWSFSKAITIAITAITIQSQSLKRSGRKNRERRHACTRRQRHRRRHPKLHPLLAKLPLWTLLPRYKTSIRSTPALVAVRALRNLSYQKLGEGSVMVRSRFVTANRESLRTL